MGVRLTAAVPRKLREPRCESYHAGAPRAVTTLMVRRSECASVLPCSHPCTQTTHAPSTVRLYAVHAAVSSATGVTGDHFSCATSAANRLAEGREVDSETAVAGGWRGRSYNLVYEITGPGEWCGGEEWWMMAGARLRRLCCKLHRV